MRLHWLVAAAMLVVGFAGCTDNIDTPEMKLNAYKLSTSGVPSLVAADESFSFELQATGAPESTSTHIGAHYWSAPPQDPTASLADGRGCEHTSEETAVPGTYTVTCAIEEAGTWHVYGHVRVEIAGQKFDFWAAPVAVNVAAYTLSVRDVPDALNAGESFTFTMTADGAPNMASTHIGAHYWATPQTDPTGGLADARACDHLEAEAQVPGEYQVTCRMDEPGTWHIYGHVRVQEGDTKLDFWAPAETVVVRPI